VEKWVFAGVFEDLKVWEVWEVYEMQHLDGVGRRSRDNMRAKLIFLRNDGAEMLGKIDFLCRWFGIVPILVRGRFAFDPLLVHFGMLIINGDSEAVRFWFAFGSILIR